jgi:hypothetical protein
MSSEIVGLNGELLLECSGCEWHVPELVARSFHDRWDSGETISGEYCRECCEIISSGHSLPNMRAGYRRP